MKKSIIVTLLTFIMLISSGISVAASDIQYLEDKEFSDMVKHSEDMELISYGKTVRNKFGRFTCQYTAKSDNSKVIYELPKGSVMIGFEVIFIRPVDDLGGQDSFSIRCGSNGVADKLIGNDKSRAFMFDYDNVGGQVIDVFTTDETGEMLKSNGYNTLEIDFDVSSTEKTPIGIQMVALYYIQAEYEGVTVDGVKIENSDLISGKIGELAFNFNANISGVETEENDILLMKNDEQIPADIEFKNNKMTVKPQEGYKYGKNYKIKFSDKLLNSGIGNLPQEFDFSTSESDFILSGENLNIDANTLKANFKIFNHTKSSKKAIVCLVSYKNSMVLDKNYTVAESLSVGENEITTGTVNCEGADEVILMIWDNLLDMNPLTKEIRKELSHE